MLHDGAVLQYEHAVGKGHDVDRVVGDDQHGGAATREGAAEQPAYVVLGGRVERSERLVEQYQGRVGRQGPRQGDPRDLAA